MDFFDYLISKNNSKWLIEFMKILSNENRFSEFNKNDKVKFTKKLKKMSKLEKKNIEDISIEKYSFSNIFSSCNEIKMTNNRSWCEELLRHIRNSIFHGKSEVVKSKGKVYFVFKDYKTDKRQSAYICLEENNVKYILRLYNEVLCQIKTTKSYADDNYKKREVA